MSGMKLRDSIRAPVRYGEDDFETPSWVSLRHGYDDSIDDSMELGESGMPRPQKRRRPNTVPFDPKLPPAAFPSLNRPRPGRESTSSKENHAVGDRQRNLQGRDFARNPRNLRSMPIVPSFAPEIEQVPMNQLENHFASNNTDNPVYAKNMHTARTPRTSVASGSRDVVNSPDSDDDPLPDATQALLDAIPNPRWKDLHKAMQVEIVENTMRYHSWRRVCDLLDLGPDERTELKQVISIRNKQIERENKRLEQMRCKQRKALMRIDNSDLKLFQPPPQLVLKRIARETNRSLVLTKYTDLLMCQAHDVLKARQYLHQHELPRRYAGDWGDSLVVLRESEQSPHEPDKFEWKESLRFSPPPDEIETMSNPCLDPTIIAKTEFIHSIGMNGTMNPKDLVRRSTDPEPTMNWGRYYERNPDLSWDTTKPRLGGIVKMTIGSNNAAQIEQYAQTGVRPQELTSLRQDMIIPGSPQPELLQETPSGGSRNVSHGQSISQQPARPSSRVLTGNWPSIHSSPSESQARYQRKIQQAQLEKQQVEAEAMRRRYNLQPDFRVNGIGVGISPKYGNQHPLPLNQPSGENLPSNFFARAYRGMAKMNIDRLMDEFVCYEPTMMPEESEPEQHEEEQPDDQPSSSEVSSITDVSMDDVMLVPTDGCSSSQ